MTQHTCVKCGKRVCSKWSLRRHEQKCVDKKAVCLLPKAVAKRTVKGVPKYHTDGQHHTEDKEDHQSDESYNYNNVEWESVADLLACTAYTAATSSSWTGLITQLTS